MLSVITATRHFGRTANQPLLGLEYLRRHAGEVWQALVLMFEKIAVWH